MNPTFFQSSHDFRQWLAKNHDKAQELWVGYYKKNTGKPSMTWPESVDEALCFGWIDGIRKSVDDTSYAIRFTPRKPRSFWSAVNIKRVEELTKLGRMQPTGLKAFEKRAGERSGAYSYEQGSHKLPAAYEAQFKANKKAWAFFQSQAPWYQRTAIHWVMSAKKEETRSKRLATLIEDSSRGRTVAPLTRATRGK